MDHYLTVRHFTVAEGWKPLISILGHTLPSTLNAMTLKTFKGLGLQSLGLRALWAISERDLSILTRDCFCFFLPLLMQWAPQHPFIQIRNISPGRRKMGHGEDLASWLTNMFLAQVFSAGPFEAQLGTFSQGRYKALQKEVPDHFLFPTCLSSQFLTLSKFCWNSVNLSFLSNFKEFAGSAATIRVPRATHILSPESGPYRYPEGSRLDSSGAPEGTLTSWWVDQVPLEALLS